MLDEYIIGDYRRNSPEASVPIINFATREHRLGGLGNVALNLKEFGIDPVVVTIIGNDNAGDIIETLLHNHEVESVLIKSGDRPTTVKHC